ncbi:diguanylate cyclase domain-containing protein [Actinoplanes sp. NPDC051859]|uniref:diguanylate cyclase domain-containing protein n=1 Tax=Actinoplanes sp. NPDC051859 TaxID=3363909 RepID=UPI00379DB6FC
MPRVRLDPVLGCLLAASVVLLGWLTLGTGTPRAMVVACWAAMSIADLVLYLLARRVYRKDAMTAAPQRFWRAVAVTGLIFAAGDSFQLLLTLLDPAVRTLAPSTLQTVSAIGGAAYLVCVTMSYPNVLGTRQARTRFFLDAATIMTAVGVVAWCLVTRPALSDAGPNAFFTAVVGSGVLLVGVFAAAKLGLGGNSPMVGAAALPMILAAVTQGVANIVVPSDGNEARLPVHLSLLLAPTLLFAFGPRIQELHDRHQTPDRRRTDARRFSLLPYVATAVTFGVFIAVLSTGLGPSAWGALVGLILNVSLVIVRQILALRENEHLLDRLDESLLEITRRERRLESLLRHSSDVTSVIDRAGHLTYASPALRRILGLDPAAVLDRPVVDLLHPDDRKAIRPRLDRLGAEAGAVMSFRSRWRHADGSWRWLEVTATNLTGEPAIGGIVANAHDVTEAHELQEQLRHQATHDPLTGLANRRLFADRMREIQQEDAAVLLIDLDGFKSINDTYGHSAGDQVLLHVAACLRMAARSGELVARFGGDEFAILVMGGDEPTARGIADRFLDLIAAPADIAGRSLAVRASIGLVVGSAADPDALLHSADMQMYAQKQHARTKAAEPAI